eukprot:241706-Prymnesium_polylepis.1
MMRMMTTTKMMTLLSASAVQALLPSLFTQFIEHGHTQGLGIIPLAGGGRHIRARGTIDVAACALRPALPVLWPLPPTHTVQSDAALEISRPQTQNPNKCTHYP